MLQDGEYETEVLKKTKKILKKIYVREKNEKRKIIIIKKYPTEYIKIEKPGNPRKNKHR